MASRSTYRQTHPADWTAELRDPAWNIYEAVIDAAEAAGVPFAVGGAFGLATYTNVWRDTKDLDLFVLPRDRRRMISLVTRAGLTDYYEQLPYDRRWIYRATADGVIVDTIWAMANRRARVDEWWLSGPEVLMRGRTVKVVPAEAMLWDKLYIMQRERCDWPDIMNLLYTQGVTLEWRTIFDRIGGDVPLLTGALSVFRWLSPGVSRRFPQWLWKAVQLPLPGPERPRAVVREHVTLLDSRPWFAQAPVRSRGA
jgi:hypothetical protein